MLPDTNTKVSNIARWVILGLAIVGILVIVYLQISVTTRWWPFEGIRH